MASMKVASIVIFFFSLRMSARLSLSLIPGKLSRMPESASHVRRACSGVSTSSFLQKGHMVARGSSGVYFPVSLLRLCELVRSDATLLCADIPTGSKRYAAGLFCFSL